MIISKIINFLSSLKESEITHINTQNDLNKLCKNISKIKICAIDTEFMCNRTYYQILSLIQINLNGKLFIIDILNKSINLSPFYKIMSDRKIKKIFHSIRQDIEIIYRYGNIKCAGILDTQMMSNFCGYGRNVGYSFLVKKFFLRKINKELQRSDWNKRPLTEKQFRYASLDVKYLLKIYYDLEKILKKKKKLKWLSDEMELELDELYSLNPSSQENLIKKFKLRNKKDYYIKNVILLTKFRDDIAKEKNFPRGFIFKDDVLEEIALQSPNTIYELEKCGKYLRKMNISTKERIISIINNKDNNQNITINNNNIYSLRLTPKQVNLYNKILNSLNKIAKNHQVNPDLIITKVNLKHIIIGNKPISDLLKGWRYDIFGKYIKKWI